MQVKLRCLPCRSVLYAWLKTQGASLPINLMKSILSPGINFMTYERLEFIEMLQENNKMACNWGGGGGGGGEINQPGQLAPGD